MDHPTLDPQNWDETRKIAHQMLDDMIDHLQTIADKPIWTAVPPDVEQQLKLPIPHEPSSLSEVYQDFSTQIFNYSMGNAHPRFWGWVMGNGTVTGMLGDMLSSGMNPNMGGGNHGANYVEAQVINWTKEMFRFPPGSSGLLVTGGSMANLIGLAVARNVKITNVRDSGIEGKYRIYCSTETHSSIQKAVELLGMGSSALRKVEVDTDFQMSLSSLERAIQEDKTAGIIPICIVGTTGTTNIGATDDLTALSKLAKKYDLWFHVDGAFGSLTAITPDFKHLSDGIELADSLAFDLHKWVYLPFGIGGILIKDKSEHINTFTLTPAYLEHGDRGVHSGKYWFSDYGVELTRDFKALKAWMVIKEHGIDHIGKVIQKNIEQARYLEKMVRNEPKLDILAPVPLNIVCLRYNNSVPVDNLNDLNKELLILLHERSIAIPSYTTFGEIYAIRVCITNFRTRYSDLDLLISAIVEVGDELRSQYIH